jgi:hypothetical protein
MLDAYNQVRANKGSAGIDGITIDEIDDYLRKHWLSTKELIKQSIMHINIMEKICI